jgi:flagellar biosynthesis protein FlhG
MWDMSIVPNNKLSDPAPCPNINKDDGNGKAYKVTGIRTPPTNPRVVAVGGGKGGIGKTVISTLIGICLANMKKKTVILDADFSGANLHTCLNTFDPRFNLYDFLRYHQRDMNRLMTKTEFENLHIVNGSPGVLGSGNFSFSQKQKIIRNLRKLRVDYVILDLAAGTGYNELDLFLAADDGIVVCLADPMSIQDAFGFVRASLLRKLQRTFIHWPEFLSILNQCANLRNGKDIRSLESVLDEVPNFDLTWRHLIKDIIKNFRLKLVMNMVQNENDGREMQALRLTLKSLLGVPADIWGTIRFDPCIRTALRQLRPDLLLSPLSLASEDIVRLVSRNIIGRELMDIEAKNPIEISDPQGENEKSDFKEMRICSYKCVAWNCCDKKQGGLPCTKSTAWQTCVTRQ